MLRKNLANILTIANLILGLLAIIFMLDAQYFNSMIFILAGALTDRLDGIVARKMKIESALGKYLDSNSDLITFGVSPALLIYLSVFNPFDVLGIISLFSFVICGAWRLAKYNATEFDGVYQGVPITIAGALLALVFLLNNVIHEYFIAAISFFLAYSMISTFKFKKI